MPAPAGSFDLAGLARSRGFAALADAFDDASVQHLYYPLPPTPEPPIPGEPSAILTLLARYGMRPSLVGALLDRWADRPLDCGLIAWDALHQTLLGDTPDDLAFRDRCRTLIAPLRTRMPPPGELCPDLSLSMASAFVDSLATTMVDAPDDIVEKGAGEHSLIAVRELSRRPFGKQLFARPTAREGLRDFGRMLGNARLYSLGAVYLDLALRTIGDPNAVIELAEVMLDARADARAPHAAFPEAQTEPPFPGYVEYTSIRKLLAANEFLLAKGLTDKQLGRWFKKPGIGVDLVNPEASAWVLQRGPFKVAEISALALTRPDWRYLQRARLYALVGTIDDPESLGPVEAYDQYLNNFGFDERVQQVYFKLLPKKSKARNASVTRTIVEAAHNPWSFEVWQSLGAMTTMKDAESVRKLAREKILVQVGGE